MINLGIRAHDYGKDDPENLFAKIHGDGFSCIQLALKKAIKGIDSLTDVTTIVIEIINEAACKNNIHIAILGAYIEPALTDSFEQKKNVSEFTASINFARMLDADCIATETTPRSKQPQATPKETLDALLQSLWDINARCAGESRHSCHRACGYTYNEHSGMCRLYIKNNRFTLFKDCF